MCALTCRQVSKAQVTKQKWVTESNILRILHLAYLIKHPNFSWKRDNVNSDFGKLVFPSFSGRDFPLYKQTSWNVLSGATVPLKVLCICAEFLVGRYALSEGERLVSLRQNLSFPLTYGLVSVGLLRMALVYSLIPVGAGVSVGRHFARAWALILARPLALWASGEISVLPAFLWCFSSQWPSNHSLWWKWPCMSAPPPPPREQKHLVQGSHGRGLGIWISPQLRFWPRHKLAARLCQQPSLCPQISSKTARVLGTTQEVELQLEAWMPV